MATKVTIPFRFTLTAEVGPHDESFVISAGEYEVTVYEPGDNDNYSRIAQINETRFDNPEFRQGYDLIPIQLRWSRKAQANRQALEHKPETADV